MSQFRQKHHITNINIVAFVGSALFGNIGGISSLGSNLQIISWHISSAMLIAACTLSSFKLAREYWDIPASGFVMLAIAFGVFYVEIGKVSHGSEVLGFSNGVFLFVPAMFLIAYYKGFPAWLKLLGLASCVPFSIILFRSYISEVSYKSDKVLFAISFMSIQLTGICWSYFFWKQDKAAQKIQKESEKK